MDFNKVKSQIKKISRTIELIEADGEITKLEVELLKDYIKRLYELTILEGESTGEPKPMTSKSKVEAEPYTNGTTSKKVDSPKPKVAKIVQEKVDLPEPPVSPVEVKEEIAEVIVEEKPSEKAPEIASKPQKAKKTVPSEIMALFEEKEAKELSEKLSKMAIKDIEKSMSINEKIFTINELFNGNSQEFKSCLAKVNQMTSYQEAIDYLSLEVATPYDWAEKEKRKKAIKFIHLVSRKFK